MEKELFPNRVVFLQRIVSLATKSKFSTSICIDAGWGYGKSFFLEKLKGELSKYCHVIDFNSWKWDIESEPLIAIMNEIVASEPTKKIKEKINSSLKNFAKLIIPIALDKVLPGLGALVDQFNLPNCNKTEFDNINLYSQIQENIKEICNTMLTTNKQKLVFLVDELDRCNPNYAINVLERFKHFLSIDNVCFVFAVNQEQLEKSVEHVFGNIDANRYLEKFFDFKFSLPLPDTKEFCQILQNEYKKEELSQFYIDSYRILSSLIAESENHISLREIEKLFKKQKYLLSIIDKKDKLMCFSVPVVIFASEFATNYISVLSKLHTNSSYKRNEQWAKDILDRISFGHGISRMKTALLSRSTFKPVYDSIFLEEARSFGMVLLSDICFNDISKLRFDYICNMYSMIQ